MLNIFNIILASVQSAGAAILVIVALAIAVGSRAYASRLSLGPTRHHVTKRRKLLKPLVDELP